MFFHGNFAIISPATLIQMLCQEQRSVIIVAQRGNVEAMIQIFDGLIVAARCADLRDAEAVYQLAAWDSGQFRVELAPEPPNPLSMTMGWEELLLEAARRRDELELALPALPPYPSRQQIDELLNECPSLSGVALVSYDGRLLAAVGMEEALVDVAVELALGLAMVRELLGNGRIPSIYIGNGHKLLLHDRGDGTLLLAVPMSGASLTDASNQITTQLVAL